MTSFALAIEPAAQPRLAAAACLCHVTAATFPWFALCPPAVAAGLSVVAAGACWMTLARVPGGVGRLRAVDWRPGRCRVRLAGGGWQPATPDRRSRAYASLVLLELRVDGRRVGWLLPRSALAQAPWRRLKALIRLAC